MKGESIKPEDAKPGDLIFFAAKVEFTHVGIVYSNFNKD